MAYRKMMLLGLAVLLLMAALPNCMAQAETGADAMKCCQSMPCHPANRSHDCCKKMAQPANVFLLAPSRTIGPGPTTEISMVLAIDLSGSLPLSKNYSEAKQQAPPGLQEELYLLQQSLRI